MGDFQHSSRMWLIMHMSSMDSVQVTDQKQPGIAAESQLQKEKILQAIRY